jgi:nitroreductase
MDIHQLCEARFSARKYTSEKVSDEDLAYILDCVRLAPSAVNRQPWKFVVVKSEEAKAKVQKAYQREWFYTAPMYIVAYKNTAEEWVRKYDNKPHGDIDVTIALEHLALAATERGLGTCWVCAFDKEVIARGFNLPPQVEPIALIPIGYPAGGDTPAKKRRSLEEIVKWGNY